jgi:hypothetical protein
MENTQFLFSNFCKEIDGVMIGLKTIKGTIYFSETYETNNSAQLLYNTTTITSLKDLAIVCSSKRPINFTSVF